MPPWNHISSQWNWYGIAYDQLPWSTRRRTQDDQGLRAKTLTGIYEVVACAGVDRHFTPRVSQHHARGWTRTSQTKMTDPWSRVRVQQLTLYLLCCRSKVSTTTVTGGSMILKLCSLSCPSGALSYTSSTWTFPFWESSSWTHTTWRYKFLHLDNMYN